MTLSKGLKECRNESRFGREPVCSLERQSETTEPIDRICRRKKEKKKKFYTSGNVNYFSYFHARKRKGTYSKPIGLVEEKGATTILVIVIHMRIFKMSDFHLVVVIQYKQRRQGATTCSKKRISSGL